MRATVMYGAGDVRIENVPDARIIEPTDAVVTVTRACICGSDLWPYQKMEPTDTGRVMGHEAIGVVEAVGGEVRKIRRGDVVIMLFAFSERHMRLLPRWPANVVRARRLFWHDRSRRRSSGSSPDSPRRRNALPGASR